MRIQKILLFAIVIACQFISCSASDKPDVQVTLAVDNPNFNGTCPHDFVFTGTIGANTAGIVFTYIWERSTGNSPEASVTLPAPGAVIVQDTLRVNSSGNVSVKIHVIRPQDKVSNEVVVSAFCQ